MKDPSDVQLQSIDQFEHDSQQQIQNYLMHYNTILPTPTDKTIKFSSIIQYLNANSIQYNPEEDHHQLYLQLLHHSFDYRTLTLKVTLGPFTTIINILNQTEPSSIHKLNCLYGTFGNVYLLEMENYQLAIKCIKVREEERGQDVMLRAIKQYTINKIASAIGVGPKIMKVQEFDILIYQNCFEFCMERCLLSEQYPFGDQDYDRLRKKLAILHQLKIVHCDIKPTNIVYSPTLQSAVFLDFGFSKILSTTPGTATKTKYVGSLQTCCKQMLSLYQSKQFGKVDLFYNDAVSLDNSRKLAGRYTGSNLKEILKWCDYSSSSLHLPRIYYTLYKDKVLAATGQFIKSQHKDKRLKVMQYLDGVPPTESLRQFYFQFLYAEWGQSIVFNSLSRKYAHSHRHHLQTELSYSRKGQDDEHKNFYLSFLEKILNCKIDLFKLDHQLISYQEICINYNDFMANTLSCQDQYDFFISHVGNLAQNNYIKQKNQGLTQQILDKFVHKICNQGEVVGSTIQKLKKCFSFLIGYCLSLPVTQWKVRTYQRSLSEIMLLSKIDAFLLEEHIMSIICLQCGTDKKIKLLHSFCKAFLYQKAAWTFCFRNNQQFNKIISNIEEILNVEDQGKVFEKIINFDLILLKVLLGNQIKSNLIENLKNDFQKLSKQDSERRSQVVCFLQSIFLYEEQLFEECRIQIEAAFSPTEMPITIKPTYFLLANVYYRLHNDHKCRQLLRLIETNLMTKEILYEYNSMLKAITSISPQSSKIIHIFVRNSQTLTDPSILMFVLHQYFACKHELGTQMSYSFYQTMLRFTKDDILIDCLHRLNVCIRQQDKILLYERVIAYFLNLQEEWIGESDKNKSYVDKLILDKYWLQRKYELIIETLGKKGQNLQKGMAFVYNDPELFDYSLRAHLMLGQDDEVKVMIDSLNIRYSSSKPSTFISSWIQTTSFVLLFYSLMEGGWKRFREFLLAVIDYINVHPVRANTNCFVRCLRYTFSHEVPITQIDLGLATLFFPAYQWKYSFISFFHIEAISKMARLRNYLNKEQLKALLWRAASFLPFLRPSEAKWLLQEYFELILMTKSKSRYQRFILLKCRKHVNYIGQLSGGNYRLKHLKFIGDQTLRNLILKRRSNGIESIKTQKTTKISNFTKGGIFWKECKQKLRKYHNNVGNQAKGELRIDCDILRLQLQ